MMIKRLAIVIAFCLVGPAWAGNTVDCVYRAKTPGINGAVSIKEYKGCGTTAKGKLLLSKALLRRMNFDRYGLSTVLVAGQHYYVKRDGAMLPVVAFDNWADDYSEGLVRSDVNGKIAFYDRRFTQVIPPKYDWAAPFKDRAALVCLGCVIQSPDEDGHREVAGGEWGYIDKKGKELVPVRHSRQEAERLFPADK